MERTIVCTLNRSVLLVETFNLVYAYSAIVYVSDGTCWQRASGVLHMTVQSRDEAVEAAISTMKGY